MRKFSIQKINTQVWFCYMKKKTTITINLKKEQRAEDRYSSEPEKAHPTASTIVALFYTLYLALALVT